MIDLSEFPVGQRFRTRGGRKVRLLSVTQGMFQFFPRFTLGIEVAEGLPLQPQEYSKSGKALSAIDWDEITSPIYSVPANTRRIPPIKLDPVLEKAV